MKKETLASANLSNASCIVFVESDELDAWTAILNEEPCFQVGSVYVHESAWPFMHVVSCALELHERGHWGVVDADQKKRNDRALVSPENGCLISWWAPKNGPAFWITTDLMEHGNTSEVCLFQVCDR